MRVEGGYTFRAPAAAVYAALTTPETLARLLPSCERLIQLGPADADGAATFEARLRVAGGGVMTARIAAVAARRPAHARFELDLYDPPRRLHGRGLFDLVDQGTHTVGAYVLDMLAADRAEPAGLTTMQVQAAAQALCVAMARGLHTGGASTSGAPARRPRGRIVALRPADRAVAPGDAARLWAQRGAWLGTGLLLGLGGLAVATAVARRLVERADSPDAGR